MNDGITIVWTVETFYLLFLLWLLRVFVSVRERVCECVCVAPSMLSRPEWHPLNCLSVLLIVISNSKNLIVLPIGVPSPMTELGIDSIIFVRTTNSMSKCQKFKDENSPRFRYGISLWSFEMR